MRWPYFDDEQIAAVADVLRSGRVNYWTGPYVRDFEAAYACALGRQRAIALANGTLALELALQTLDLAPADEVIVTPRSFMASAGCVVKMGAVPVFADVDRDTQSLTAATIEPVLTERTRAVIVVHLGGRPAPMVPIMELCRRRGIRVIEDCAQAHGAAIDGQPVGSFGDFAAFSFCQDKIITTGGEGGLLCLDDEAAWKRAWSFKDHGKDYDAVHAQEHPPGFRWLHHNIGTNWRMTSIQAVLGSIQLGRLTATQTARQVRADLLLTVLDGLAGLRIPVLPPGARDAWYRFYAFVRPDMLKPGWNRDRILREIMVAGGVCFSGSCSEIYLEQAFQRRGLCPKEPLAVARELGETSLALLVDPTIPESDVLHTATIVRDVLEAAA
jgi:dTDP-4-amino-4,6-dideoxygalactose transaminase